MYHGSHTNETLIIHEGICLTDDYSTAEHYAGGGWVHEVEIDMDSLTVERVEGYDHDTNSCPADSAEYRAAKAAEGVDVLVYEDEDDRGREHTCYRLISDRALRAVK